jgi:hypothetical protein
MIEKTTRSVEPDHIVIRITRAGWEDQRFREGEERVWSERFPGKKILWEVVDAD